METDASQLNHEDMAAPRKRGRTVLLYLLAILLVLAVFLLWMYHGVSPVVHGEFGEGLPPAAAFCRAEGAFCYSAKEDLSLGRHLVQVVTRFRVVPCLLIVADTTAPTAQPVTVEFPSGYEPTPDQFITDLKDADRVGVSFAEAYDFSPAGTQTVIIHLEDGSGNQSTVTAAANIRATVDQVVVEAGSPAPTVESFLSEGFHGQLLDPITEEMLRTPGAYPLRIQCPENGRIFTSTLAVQDTVAPSGAGQLLILSPGESVSPEAFLTEAEDETALSYSFALAPDPDSREIQNILVRVTDAGGNQTDVPAQVLYSSLGNVTVEAKNALLTGEDLGHPEAIPEPFMANVPGTYPIRVQLGSSAETVMVTLVDTTAPVLTLQEGPFYTLHELSPEQLLQVEDVTQTVLSFLQAPDFNNDQPQTFTVHAMDAVGNETTVTFPLTLQVDDTPPVLYGVVNRSGYVGEPILYLQEAYAEDAVDGRVDMTVDSQVILTQKGRYTVTYTATDKSGNSASKSCTYTLVEPAATEEAVHEMAQAVLGKILTPDMVTAEKLNAVFNYVRNRVYYTGSSNKTDWRREAIRGNKEGRGDCFTVYSLTRALLDELNISYMSVTRRGGATHHYWLIVNIGTGWYHFDPLISRVHKHRCFMWTNQQCKVKPYFWRFYEDSFPPIATEPFDYDAVVQAEREGRLP